MPTNNQNLQSGSGIILGPKTVFLGIAIAIVVMLSAYWAGSCNSGQSWEEKYRTYREAAQQAAQVYAESVQVEVNKITRRADVADSLATLRTQEISSIRRENQRLRGFIEGQTIRPIPIDSLPKICEGCVIRLDSAIALIDSSKILIGNQQKEIADLETRDTLRVQSIVFLRDAFNRERTVSDSLQTIIINMPKPKSSPKLFGLFHVGSNTAFLIGTATGLVAAVVIDKALENNP